ATRVTDVAEEQAIGTAEESKAADALTCGSPSSDIVRMTGRPPSLESAKMTEGDVPQTVPVTLHAYKNTYSIEDPGACERPPASPAFGNTLDTWLWYDPPIGADELDEALLPPPPDPDLLSKARELACKLGRPALLVDYGLMADEELEAAIERLCEQLAQKE